MFRTVPHQPLILLAIGLIWIISLIQPLAAYGADPARDDFAETKNILALQQGTSRLDLMPMLEVLPDPSGQLSLNDVIAGKVEFVKARPQIFSGVVWYRFQITAAKDAPHRWVLAFGEPDMDRISLFVPMGDLYHQIKAGRSVPVEDLSAMGRNHLLAFELDQYRADNETLTFYLRLESLHKIRLENLAIWDPSQLISQEIGQTAIIALHLGALLVIAVAYLIFGASFKRWTLVFYALFVGSNFAKGLTHTGLVPLILPWAGSDTNYILGGAGLVVGWMAFILMWNGILDLRRRSPVIHRLFLGGIAVLGLGLLPLFTPYFHMFVGLARLLIAAISITIFTLSVRAFLNDSHNRLELIYLLAFTPVVACIAVEIGASFIPLIPADLGRTLEHLATTIHILSLSFALAFQVHKDNSTRTQAEIQLKSQSLAMERLRTFMDMATHELRTPLAIIDSSAQMLELSPRNNQSDVNRLGTIRKSVKRMVGLIETCLIDVHDIDGTLRLAPTPIQRFLQNVIEHHAHPDKAGVHLSSTSGKSWITDRSVALMDESLISIALDTLIDNARKYDPKGGPVELLCHIEEDNLVLTVADHGPGIPPDELPSIYDKHFRGRNAQNIRGSGLGLFLVRTIADLHGGTVSVHNRPKGGLEVSLSLPMAKDLAPIEEEKPLPCLA